jgi:hypothetical protein
METLLKEVGTCHQPEHLGLERNAYATSLAVGRNLTSDPRGFALEVEGEVVQYVGRRRLNSASYQKSPSDNRVLTAVNNQSRISPLIGC